MPLEPVDLWRFLPLGYLLTVLLEMPVLLVGLSPRHPLGRRIFAGFWLTACTYPIVTLVLPLLVWRSYGEVAYLAIAETFAPAAECALFWLAFGYSPSPASNLLRDGTRRDCLAIVIANLVSFLVGRLIV